MYVSTTLINTLCPISFSYDIQYHILREFYPQFKKCSRYKREQLELLWEVVVGTVVGTYSKT